MRPHAIPVTVLTGFLGSGKTTLINRLLREAHGRRFAVIENEYGEVNVDADLLVKDGGETIVQLTNGCVCCTVRGDLANALDRLAQQRDAGEIEFDHVLIEPTGLADPGPIVRTFMAETEVLARYFLDGVVTLFDAVNGERTLAESVEAQAQLAYADRVLITKTDLLGQAIVGRDRPQAISRRSEEGARGADQAGTVGDASLSHPTDALVERIAAANSVATIQAIDLVRAPWDEMFEKLLELRGYQWDRVVFAPSASTAGGAAHTRGVSSVTFESEQPLDAARLNLALAAINARYGEALWRVKGVLAIEGARNRIVLQGVQGLLQANPSTVWRMFEPRRSRLVLIGRALDRAWLLAQLESARSSEEAARTTTALHD